MVIETIQGTRILGNDKVPKEHSTEHLKMKVGAEGAWTALALKASDPKRPANCLNRFDEFSGDVLPTKTKAKRMCKGCPAFEECDLYRRLANPTHGVYAGQVKGGNT